VGFAVLFHLLLAAVCVRPRLVARPRPQVFLVDVQMPAPFGRGRYAHAFPQSQRQEHGFRDYSRLFGGFVRDSGCLAGGSFLALGRLLAGVFFAGRPGEHRGR